MERVVRTDGIVVFMPSEIVERAMWAVAEESRLLCFDLPESPFCLSDSENGCLLFSVEVETTDRGPEPIGGRFVAPIGGRLPEPMMAGHVDGTWVFRSTYRYYLSSGRVERL